jgi:opacity protein-like surface antigen
MKTRFVSPALALLVTLSCSLLQAHSQVTTYQPYPAYQGYGWHQNRWYLKVAGGGNVTMDTELKEFFGEDTSGAEIEFDPGIRFDFGAGYNITDWFAAEVETGIIANDIDSIRGANRVDAIFSNVPIMGNIKFQLPKNYRVSPYVGAGAGVSFSILDSDEIDFGSTSMHGSESDAVFAWQAFGGIRFRLNDAMGLSIEYKYFWADDAEWEAEFSEGTFGDTSAFGRIETHSLSIVFDWTF